MDLAYAKTLLGRATALYDEFEKMIANGRLWGVQERQDPKTGEWAYSIIIDRQRISDATPLIADCANNVASALDHIAAAIARDEGHGRLNNLYFPFSLDDAEFEKRVAAAEKVLGPKMSNIIRVAHHEHRHVANHVASAKQISNDGKHWELRATSGKAHAIKWLAENDYVGQMFSIPSTAFDKDDSYEFHRSAERLPQPRGYEAMIGFEIEGLGDLVKAPTSIFPCSFRYVQGVIDAVLKGG